MKPVRVRTALALALTVTFGTPANAAPRPASSPPPAPDVARSEFFELMAAGLDTLGAPEGMVASARAAEEGDRDYPYIVPVGDLDGDDLPDTMTMTRIPAENGLGSEVVLTARRGFDGDPLWTLPTGGGVVVPVPAVGPDGDPGLLVVSYRYGASVGSIGGTATAEQPHNLFMAATQIQVDVAAVSRAGQELWRYESPSGHFLYPPLVAASEPLVAENVPIVTGTLDATGSPATDVLLALYDRTPTPEGQDDRVRTIVIDGQDGAEASTGVNGITGARTKVAPGPDLDGDGFDDYTIVSEGVTEGTESGVRALRGTDGSLLWTSRRDVSWREQGLLPVDDATGDGLADLVLRTAGSLPDPDGEEVGTRTVTLLDGVTGAEVWREPGDVARALGDISGDDRADVLLVRVVRTSTEVGVRYEARTAEGIAWEAEHRLPLEGTSQGTLSFADAGDVDRDVEEGEDEGTPDFAHHLRLLTSSGTFVREEARVIGGRTGETLRQGPLGGRPLRASVDGAGDDVVAVESWNASVRDVTAIDGLTGTALWSVRLRLQGDDSLGNTSALAADLDGDGLADLIVNASSSTSASAPFLGTTTSSERFVDAWVLSGRDATMLWHSDPLVVPEPAEVDGRVEPGRPFEWEGGPSSGTWVSWGLSEECGSEEATYRCDRLLVELANPPAAGEPSRTADATVEIGQFAPLPAPASDFDLYVYESDEFATRGPLLDSSGSFNAVERAEFSFTTTPEEPSRYVLVEVTYWQSVESGYGGSVSIDPVA